MIRVFEHRLAEPMSLVRLNRTLWHTARATHSIVCRFFTVSTPEMIVRQFLFCPEENRDRSFRFQDVSGFFLIEPKRRLLTLLRFWRSYAKKRVKEIRSTKFVLPWQSKFGIKNKNGRWRKANTGKTRPFSWWLYHIMPVALPPCKDHLPLVRSCFHLVWKRGGVMRHSTEVAFALLTQQPQVLILA